MCDCGCVQVTLPLTTPEREKQQYHCGQCFAALNGLGPDAPKACACPN